MYEGVMEKIAKFFPAYLMNPANRETFVVSGISHPLSLFPLPLLPHALNNASLAFGNIANCLYSYSCNPISV